MAVGERREGEGGEEEEVDVGDKEEELEEGEVEEEDEQWEKGLGRPFWVCDEKERFWRLSLREGLGGMRRLRLRDGMKDLCEEDGKDECDLIGLGTELGSGDDVFFPELWQKAGILEAGKARKEWLLSPPAFLVLLMACETKMAGDMECQERQKKCYYTKINKHNVTKQTDGTKIHKK